jgi:hypothetical protein
MAGCVEKGRASYMARGKGKGGRERAGRDDREVVTVKEWVSHDEG